MPRLSKRLLGVTSLVDSGDIVFDVGSDHALVPIYLVKENIAIKAYASDINVGPYNSALKNIKKHNLEGRVIALKSDGISNISEDVNSVVIAGMGGKLIVDILDQDKTKLEGIKSLILAPNIATNTVREWLMNNKFMIEKELIIEEDSKFYEVIKALRVKENVSYTEEELFFGPILLRSRNKTFIKKWQKKLNKKKKILDKIKNDKLDAYHMNLEEIKIIEKMLEG